MSLLPIGILQRIAIWFKEKMARLSYSPGKKEKNCDEGQEAKT
jgi:hypothetical protein